MLDERMGVNLFLLFAAVAWGASFVAARAVLATLHPVTLAATRFLIASAVLVPLLYRQHIHVTPVERRDVPAFLILGQLGVSIYFWLQYTGLRLTSAGVASLLVVGLAPLMTAIVSGFTLRERMSGKAVLALLFGLAGVALVVIQDGPAPGRDRFLLGSVCLLADAMCFAVYSVQVRRLSRKYPAITVTAGTTVSGAAGLAVMSAFSGDWSGLARLSAPQWGAVVYLAVVCSVLAYLAYTFALSRVEAGRASSWLYLEPVVATTLGVLILGETVSARSILGGIAILSSLYGVNSSPARGVPDDVPQAAGGKQ